MPYAKLSSESTALFASGWERIGNRSEPAQLWGIDRHGQWHSEETHFKRDADERPVYIGTQGGFGVLAASSRITVRDGNSVTAGSIPEHSRIGETWFELPGDPPTVSFTDASMPIAGAIREAAAFRTGDRFALRRFWPSAERPSKRLRAITQTVKCGGSEYCLFETSALLTFISEGWFNAITDIADYCFANEEGTRQFDRANALFVSWHISALRAKGIFHRLSYESLQSTRSVFIENVEGVLPPIARGGCACIGAVAKPTVQIRWPTASWSPVVGGFFIRGS